MPANQSKLAPRLLLALSVIMVFAVAFMLKQENYDQQQNADPYASLGGDFVLQSVQGTVSLADFKDKLIVLYFGYTYCPDVCPTSLGLLSLALQQLSDTERKKVQSVFISVDPERDTVERLKEYTSAFHPDIIGITGTPEQIAEVAKRYGVMYMKVELPNSAMKYAVDHSSRYYVVNSSGKILKIIDHGTEANKIAELLRAEMK